jgi:hypothetical protein
VDDEQGPWWTRPPEPGPQAPPVRRQRITPEHDVDVDESATEQATIAFPPTAYRPPELQQPTEYQQPTQYQQPTAYPRPRLVQPVQSEPEIEPEVEAEPPPIPKPAKPVVRRVAVVPPTPPVRPAGRDTGEEETVSLPPVRGDIFATFSGPMPVGTPGATDGREELDPAPAGRRWARGRLDVPAERLPALLREVSLPEPRVLVLGAAAALVGVLIVVVALVSGNGTKAEPEPGASAQPSPVAAASKLTGRTPDGLRQVSALDAAAQLRKAGKGPGGSIVEAWGWDDRNGRNLVVTSVASARGNKQTLRVIHIAGLDAEARTLRVMTDPNLPANCRGAGTAGFTPKALIVRDLDSNNVAEVITGWTSRCGGRANESQIRLALITDGDKYILRGEGVVGRAGIFVPAPGDSRWPKGFLEMLGTQYRTLYG